MLLHIITKKEAQYSLQDMNDHSMVNLVQGVTHMHLKQTKGRNKPKAVEEKVKS